MNKLNVYVCERFGKNIKEALLDMGDKPVALKINPFTCQSADGQCDSYQNCSKDYSNGSCTDGLVICAGSGSIMCVENTQYGQPELQVIAHYYGQDKIKEAEAKHGDKQRDVARDIALPISDEKQCILTIQNAILQYALKVVQAHNEEELYRLNMRCMDYAAVLGMIERLSAMTEEEQIKEDFIIGLETLLMPCKCSFYDFTKDPQIKLDTTMQELIDSKSKYLLFADKGVFGLKLMASAELIGAVKIQGELPCEYIKNHIDMLIHLANVAALCISNIKKNHQMISSENKYKFLSMSDFLTGIYNRRYFHKRLDKIKKNISCWPVAIFVCDIDKLKHTNDHMGHLEGDKLILKAAQVLKQTFPDSTICRIGGDEFAVVMENTSFEEVIFCNERMRNNIELMNQGDDGLPLSLSVGYSYCDDFKNELETLIHEADRRMYEKKKETALGISE